MFIRVSMTILLLFIPGYLMVKYRTLVFDHHVKPSCPEDMDICEFDWTINHTATMLLYQFNGSDSDHVYPMVYTNGSIYKRTDCDDYEEATENDIINTITTDGRRKILYTVNGQFPGPSIVVYEGQEVVVRVKNDLIMEGVTIHWHGLYQRGTPWMDGVDMVSQCPISPGQSFTYRFFAEPVGTHWYHSHLGVQRTDGLAGALIVLPRTTKQAVAIQKEKEPVEDEFVVLTQDWYSFSSTELMLMFIWNIRKYPFGVDDPRCFISSEIKKSDGGFSGFMLFESGVINGRGHNYPDWGKKPKLPKLPYETFVVKSNKTYRFRVINTGNAFTLFISVDKHQLEVISLDGHDVRGRKTDFIGTTPGERVDFLLHTTETPDNYWFRVEANGAGQVLGILQYDTVQPGIPTSVRTKCSHNDGCTAINCMLSIFPPDYNLTCIALHKLSLDTTKENRTVPKYRDDDKFVEIMLSNRYKTKTTIAVINGKSFVKPTSPLQTYPDMEGAIESCNKSDLRCEEEVCFCTNIIKVDIGTTVQFVLVAPGPLSAEPIIGLQHPIHTHGHDFHVLKVAYSRFNLSSGESLGLNQDIECESDEWCDSPKWRNDSWGGDNIPGLNLENPPIKDTILLPRHGYTVIRTVLDNPGFWFLHCHMELHQVTGMALILQVGDVDQMPPTPKNFPTCGNFNFPQKEFEDLTNQSKTSSNDNEKVGILLKKNARKLAETPPNGPGYVTRDGDNQTTIYVIVLCSLMATVFALGLCLLWQVTEKKRLIEKYGEGYSAKYVPLGSDKDNLVGAGEDRNNVQPVTYMTFRRI